MKIMKFTLALMSAFMLITLSACGRETAEPQAITQPEDIQSTQAAQDTSKTVTELFTNSPSFIRMDLGLLQLEADVLYPEQMPTTIRRWRVNYGGGSCTIDNLQRELMPNADIQTIDYTAEEQNGVEQTMIIATDRDGTGSRITGELLWYPGHFSFWKELPDTFLTADADGTAGQVDFSEMAGACSISRDDSFVYAGSFLKKAEIDISLGRMRSYAISPTSDGRYSSGYYIVHVPQIVDGINVCVYQDSGMANSLISGRVYKAGFRLRVFDSGIYSAEGFWLDENQMTSTDEYDSLISLDNALEILNKWAQSNLESKMLTVHEIRFEYALVFIEDQLILTPVWSFDSLLGVPTDHFYGVQIDAVDGSVINAVEEFLL